jgi:peroxiredoxin
MKSFPLLAVMLLGSISSFAGNPVAATTLNVKVGVVPGFSGMMHFEHLGNARLTEYVSETFFTNNDKKLSAFSRSLHAGNQIVYLNNCPVLINTGDQVQMSISPRFKEGKIQPGKFTCSWSGKDAGRQALPYLIDSLYTTGDNIATIAEADEFINTRSQQVKALIARTKVTDKENLALLNAYEQTKLISLKYNFEEAHKNLLPSKAYGDWCLNGFDLSTPAFSGLGNDGGMQETLNYWWASRKLQDSTLKEDTKLMEVMLQAKSDVVKGSLATGLILGEARYNGLTQRLKNMFALTGNLNKEIPAKHMIDSLQKAYSQLEPGQPAFNFALKNDQGDVVRLSDFKGKIVIIDIWATWCSSCVASLPTYREIRDSYKDKDDIVFLTIGWESPDAHDNWMEFSKSHQIDGVNNLFLSADREEEQCKQFVARYCLTGITRWVAISQDGKILDGNLGHPASPGFKQRITNCYKMKN